MAANNNKRSDKSVASPLLMLLALLWLTISTPFVYASQQQTAKSELSGSVEKSEEESNPLAGTNEEKSESGVNSVSEYLHEIVLPGQHGQVLVKYEKCHPSDLYLAYHPELLCPPPNFVG